MTEIKLAWESYLRNGDDVALISAITQFAKPLPSEYDYPYAHRICDIKLGQQAFRVVRIADESETIFICRCDVPDFVSEGVPYWVTGEKLRRWLRLETGVDTQVGFEPGTQTKWELFK